MKPENELLANYEFKFLVVASGKNVAVEGFDRRSLDAKLAIALTANFVNNHSAEEAEVRQISGIAKQFHQVRNTTFTRWTSPSSKWGTTTASSPSPQCGKGRIFPSLRFYVKPILGNVKGQKMPFLHYWGTDFC